MLLCLDDIDIIIIYYKCSNSVSSLSLPCKIDHKAGSEFVERVLGILLEVPCLSTLYILSVILS